MRFLLNRWPLLAPDGDDGAAGQKPPDGDGAKPPVDTVSKSLYDAALADNAKLQEFSDRMKTAEKAERDKRQAAQLEQGEHKALSESLAQDKVTLEKQNAEYQVLIASLQPKATSYDSIEASLKDQVVERLKDEALPATVKIALAAIPNPLQQVQYLDAYDSEHKKVDGNPANKPASSSGGTPPGQNGDTVDFAKLVSEGNDLQDLIAKHPTAWQAQLSSTATSQPQSGFMRALGNGWASKG